MNILLLTPPLTQPNTPYPATAYLTSFLKKHGHEVHQADLGIELIDRVFSKNGLTQIFENAEWILEKKTTKNIRQIFTNQKNYIRTVEPVMQFLRGNDPTLATQICSGNFLPEATRFQQIADMEWTFGSLGISDKAKHLATLYIEDLTDFIKETVCPYFELGRYAEHLCLFVENFESLLTAINIPNNLIDEFLIKILDEKIALWNPELIGLSIPFPGNLYGALKCSQRIRSKYPDVKIVWGGGYVNTELRSLTDSKVFGFTDFILFDQGESALLNLIDFLQDKGSEQSLTNTMWCDKSNEVKLQTANKNSTVSFSDCGIPDYSDLPLHLYISLIEVANPMHKLWSDGRWNKLTLAQGCYWAKCAFCDTSLPYISDFGMISASTLADRIEKIIDQTGNTGFHFVDEAAPPKILKDFSTELLKRELIISWWTNIRFEKSYDSNLCQLMANAGCIAVSGGIEVASNRLLKLMNKGVTIEQATLSTYQLTQNGIMVHAYLMYGFPSENEQETIDSLEIVRQMFQNGLLQSAFWHRYAMTVHSPSGQNPEYYGAIREKHHHGSFANNEVAFTDHQSIDLDMLGNGLKKATYNYLHGQCFDWPLHKWFESKVPKTTIAPNYIKNILKSAH